MRNFYWLVACAVLLTVAGCGSGQKDAAQPGDGVPSLDDARVLWVYDAETGVEQAPNGKLYLDEVTRVGNDENRARLAANKSVFEYPALRPGVEATKGWPGWGRLSGVEADGTAWYLTKPDQKSMTLFSNRDGQVARKEFTGEEVSSDALGETCKPSAGWYGKGVLLERERGVLVPTTKGIWENKSGEWVMTPVVRTGSKLPVKQGVEEENENVSYSPAIYRDGNAIWTVSGYSHNNGGPGALVLRIEDGKAEVYFKTPDEFVTGLVRHGNGVYALVEKKVQDLGSQRKEYVPIRVQRLRSAPAGDLFAGFSTPDTISDFKQARLLFITRDGVQIVQPWRDGKPEPMLLLVTSKLVRRVAMPSAKLGVDHETADGMVYLHDEKSIYQFDVKTGKARECLALGQASGLEIYVAGVDGSRLCLGRAMDDRLFATPVFFWVDLKAKSALPMLRGELVAGGLRKAPEQNCEYPVAKGPDGTMWAISFEERPEGPKKDEGKKRRIAVEPGFEYTLSLLRMTRGGQGGKPEVVHTWVSKDKQWSVWPLNEGEAMVVSSNSDENSLNAMYFDGKIGAWHETLKKLLEAQHERLMLVMPNGEAYVCDHYDKVYMVRIDDAFYLADSVCRAFPNGGGMIGYSGIFVSGQGWVDWKEEPLGMASKDFRNVIDRGLMADAKSGRLLSIMDGWKSLQWVPLTKRSEPRETVMEFKDSDGVNYWSTESDLPRIRRRWILTPEAMPHASKMAKEREEQLKAHREGGFTLWFEVEHDSSDYGDFQTWDGERQAWRKLGMSLYGSHVDEDLVGNVWLVRNREVEVIAPDGKRQVIPVDSCTPATGRVVAQAKDVVWVFTRQSAIRMVLKAGAWVEAGRYSLQQQGFDVDGAWATEGEIYYRCNGALYRVNLTQKEKS